LKAIVRKEIACHFAGDLVIGFSSYLKYQDGELSIRLFPSLPLDRSYEKTKKIFQSTTLEEAKEAVEKAAEQFGFLGFAGWEKIDDGLWECELK